MTACWAQSRQRSHSHLKVMDIFCTLGSGSLSVTAMLDFSGKARETRRGLSPAWQASTVHRRPQEKPGASRSMYVCTSIHCLGEDDTAKVTQHVSVNIQAGHEILKDNFCGTRPSPEYKAIPPELHSLESGHLLSIPWDSAACEYSEQRQQMESLAHYTQ